MWNELSPTVQNVLAKEFKTVFGDKEPKDLVSDWIKDDFYKADCLSGLGLGKQAYTVLNTASVPQLKDLPRCWRVWSRPGVRVVDMNEQGKAKREMLEQWKSEFPFVDYLE